MAILERIESPTDLNDLTDSELVTLADELRTFMLTTLNDTGGHLGAGLGAVELTIALHTVFDTPYDRLVWDVGHQAYPHKILTKRANHFASIRQTDGLAPFPDRAESPYDTFGVGHSSTSISAALGMALAAKQSNEDRRHVAIIGDGGMTAGMAFEALNHAGHVDANLLVVLNDNNMSISHNVGALSNYFSRILSSKMYASMREGSKKVLSRVPPVWEFARRTESHLKGMVAPGTLFEELGFNYIGPVDGHDLPTLLKTLQNVRDLKGPQLLHVISQKGKGYGPAEAEPIRYHAVSPGFYTPKPATAPITQAKKPKTYSQVFGQWLCEAASKNDKVIGVTPAMCEGSGMVEFAQRFPERYMDVGIAEQHAVTVAAGLACEGMRPIVAIYSTFLQRAYDQLVHDVAIQNLPVVFALDRAGLVGDGPTHSGAFDISFLRCIPNMILMTPSDEKACRDLLETGLCYNGPSAIRYPRGSGIGADCSEAATPLPLGKARPIRNGSSGIALLAFGPILHTIKPLAEAWDCTLIDMQFVKPLDEACLRQLSKDHKTWVTFEENSIAGGAGSAVSEFISQANLDARVIHFGIPDHFVAHGSQTDMLQRAGLTLEAITERLKALLPEQELIS